jgi:hypothetical protein
MALAHQINKTLVYFLIFTVISSALAYKIVLSAYDTVFETYSGYNLH